MHCHLPAVLAPPMEWYRLVKGHALLISLDSNARTGVMMIPGCCVQPDETGLSMARALDEMGVPVTMVLDSGAARIMER